MKNSGRDVMCDTLIELKSSHIANTTLTQLKLTTYLLLQIPKTKLIHAFPSFLILKRPSWFQKNIPQLSL